VVILEVIIELFGELVLQLIGQLLAALGEHTVAAHRTAGPRSRALSILGHIMFGGIVGALSLLVVQHSLIDDPTARVVSLFASPIAAGAVTAAIGWLLRRNDRATVPLERFGYGFLFAFSFALVRFLALG
jgi:hypothetical protein